LLRVTIARRRPSTQRRWADRFEETAIFHDRRFTSRSRTLLPCAPAHSAGLDRRSRRPGADLGTAQIEEVEMNIGFDGDHRRVAILFAIGALVLALYPIPKNFIEWQNRTEVMEHGKVTTALVDYSTGLQSVIVSWVDANEHVRGAEAMTRKQVAGRNFAGKTVAIRYVDDPARAPVILSEVEDRERDNRFWMILNPIFMIGFVSMAIAASSYRARLRPKVSYF